MPHNWSGFHKNHCHGNRQHSCSPLAVSRVVEELHRGFESDGRVVERLQKGFERGRYHNFGLSIRSRSTVPATTCTMASLVLRLGSSLHFTCKVLQVLVKADDMAEFDINLISNLPRTTLTTEQLNRGVGNLLVVSVLVVGVTFAGAITVPGSSHDLNSGSSKNLMRAFFFFDMLAMNFSLIAAIILCQISLGRTSYVTISMEIAIFLNFYSLICMGLAFTFILAITVQERNGFFTTIVTFQAHLFVVQVVYSYRLMVSTANSILSFLQAKLFKLMARMEGGRMYGLLLWVENRITSSSNWIACKREGNQISCN
ncbi:hypothetical protein POTOM_057215 [Populus tomentosa]|uniref:PGG domain-containing protein n=1 Tax=Populus tomentosa TaxID=118781 RepID=A0A8X7XSB1_POPTO|nr:hypothetical protein POTOM_057215 [Populus tomentosa]